MTEIVTEGSGQSSRIADRAELSVRFSATGRNRVSAVEGLGVRVAAAEPALTLPGVEVTARRLSVHTDWRRDRRSGCVASEDIEVRVVELTVLEDVLGRLVVAEPANLAGPHWLLDDLSEVVLEAQAAAVADARRRAEGYAAALGARLGSLVRLSEAREGGPPGPLRVAAAVAYDARELDLPSLGLEPEPVQITVRCTTTWDLPGG